MAEVFVRKISAFWRVGGSSILGRAPVKANMRFLRKFSVADFTPESHPATEARIEDHIKTSIWFRRTADKIVTVKDSEGGYKTISRETKDKWRPESEILVKAKAYQEMNPPEYAEKSFEQIKAIEHALNVKTTAVGIAAATSTIIFGLLGGLPNDVLNEVGINFAGHGMLKLWCQSLSLVSLGTWIPTWWRAVQMKNSQNLYNYFRISSGKLPLDTIF